MEPKITISSKKNAIKVSLEPKEAKTWQPAQPAKTSVKRNKASSAINWRAASVQSSVKEHKKRKKGNQEMISMILSIVGAIIVGIIMGASLLSVFFSDEPTYSQNSIDSHLQQATQTPLSVYLLQAGNFKHKSGAQEKVYSYRKQGLSAVLSAKPPYRIYLGVSMDQTAAKKLAADFEKKGTKVYIKEITMPINKNESKMNELLDQQGQQIFTELSKNSIAWLTTDTKTDKKFSIQPQLMEAYQKLLSSAQNIKHQLSAKEQKKLMKMVQSLDQAVQSAKEAKTYPSQALMWQIQEGLVRYITTYKQS